MVRIENYTVIIMWSTCKILYPKSFFSAEGGVRSFDRDGLKSRKVEGRATLGKNKKYMLSSYCNVEHRQNFVKHEVSRLNEEARDLVVGWVEDLH